MNFGSDWDFRREATVCVETTHCVNCSASQLVMRLGLLVTGEGLHESRQIGENVIWENF